VYCGGYAQKVKIDRAPIIEAAVDVLL
jgi:hypothetical protein